MAVRQRMWAGLAAFVAGALAMAYPAAAQEAVLPPFYSAQFSLSLDYDLDTLVASERFSYLGTGQDGNAIGGIYPAPASTTSFESYPYFATTRSSFFIGTTRLNDPGGATHLVLGLRSDYPVAGVEFNQLFAGSSYTEAQLIDAVDYFYNGSGEPGDPQFDIATQALFGFGSEVYAAGSPLGAGFAPSGGAFTFYAFSTGMPIGSGVSTFNPPAAPEPVAWTLAIVGFGAVGVVLRRRRPAPQAAIA